MTLASITLKNFTVFEDARFDLCPGVNVLIGANGTGKTHAMKAAYASLASASGEESNVAHRTHEKFVSVFRPERGDVGRLIRRTGSPPKAAWVWLDLRHGESFHVVLPGSPLGLDRSLPNPRHLPSSLYIPSREVFSMSEGFIAAYRKRELSFDETFLDLCVALDALPLRQEAADEMGPLRLRLETILGGKVLRDGNRFYVEPDSGDRVEAHLVAEGLRKIATLAHLVTNGSIAPGTILFWDEPETNLNPKLIVQLADVLVDMAKLGVQIVLATHDYLLSSRLSLLAEYEQVPPNTIRFFSLAREVPDGPVQVTAGDTLADLPENLIADEFARQYDFRRELFDRSHGG